MLIVTETYLPFVGGGVRYEVDLVNHFRTTGHTVDVVTIGESRRGLVERQEGGSVYRLSKHLGFNTARLSAAMISFMLRRAPSYDLIHFNAPNPMGELAYYLAWHLGRRARHTVCSYHGAVIPEKPFARQYNGWLFPAYLKTCERIIVSSPNIVRYSAMLQRFADKVQVIPYGIDTRYFSPAPNWEVRLHHQEPLRFLFVGRLVRYKGLSVFLEALSRTRIGRVDIIGDGPLYQDIREQITRQNLHDRVTLHGYVSDEQLLAFYQQVDVIVLPSIDQGESFGYVLAEGMASGACAVSTELGTSTSFVNIDGETGLVVPPNDVNALANAMNLLYQDRTLLTRYRAHARQRVLNLFSRDRMLQQTVEMYQELGLNL